MKKTYSMYTRLQEPRLVSSYALRFFFFFLSFWKSAPVILLRGFATRAIFFCLVVKTRGMAYFSCATFL